jgi:hypothetical protein
MALSNLFERGGVYVLQWYRSLICDWISLIPREEGGGSGIRRGALAELNLIDPVGNVI